MRRGQRAQEELSGQVDTVCEFLRQEVMEPLRKTKEVGGLQGGSSGTTRGGGGEKGGLETELDACRPCSGKIRPGECVWRRRMQLWSSRREAWMRRKNVDVNFRSLLGVEPGRLGSGPNGEQGTAWS